ncbi:MAG: hypothetical protein ACO1NZ_16770 [Adhaeribacter sp.]
MSSTYLQRLPLVLACPPLHFQRPSPSGDTAPTWYFNTTMPGGYALHLVVSASGK